MKVITFLQKIIFSRFFFCISILVFVLLQIILVYYQHSTQLTSDPGVYEFFARDCLSRNTIYPDSHCFYTRYIFNPGWVNFMILWLWIFEDISSLYYFIIAINCLILLYLYKIALHIESSGRAAMLSVYVYICIPTVITIPTMLYSEPLFILLSLASFYYVLENKKYYYVLAGILIGLAYWVRPMSFVWIVPALIYMLLLRRKFIAYFYYVLPIVLVCSSVAVITHINFPDYLYKSTTGGVNLLMGANDDATGYYNDIVFEEGHIGYIPALFDKTKKTKVNGEDFYPFTNGYSYSYCDNYWKQESIKWIKQNPIKWSSMFIKKTFYLWLDGSATVNGRKEYANAFTEITYRLINVFGNVLFRFMFIVVFLSIFFIFYRNYTYLYLLLPLILGTGMTAATVINQRYNAIFIPYLCILFVAALRSCYRIFKIRLSNYGNTNH